MPRCTLNCARCKRGRDLRRLDVGIVDGHAALVCEDGCLPTKWEARREQKQRQHILSELQAWTKA